jgi:predicted dinucleotide-binding enzyme
LDHVSKTEDEMKIGVLGVGRIGGNVARQSRRVGHDVMLSFVRDTEKLQALAADIGAQTGSPAETVAFADVVVFAMPWSTIPAAIEQAGDLRGRFVIDTTNQYGDGPKPAEGQTAAAFNKERMSGGRYTKSFNTLTAQFQADMAGREGDDRIVQWICGDDQGANDFVAGLLDQMGYAPVDLGGTADCAVMEPPRRSGAVYGEEWRLPDAVAVARAVRSGEPIPPTPAYA